MDTKARVAVIVGGVVLVGMVAWVLMPSAKPKAPESDQPFAESTQQPAQDQFAAQPTTAPSTQPVAVDPFAAPTTLPSTAVNIGPSLPPADNTDSWARALDGNGTTPARSGTSLASNDGFSSHFGASPTSTTVIPADATTPKSYTVASGDSLYTISQKIYGNPSYVSKILAANPGLDAKHLKVGQSIKLPDATGTTSSLASTPAPTSGTSNSSAAATSAKTYKVQSGDSLRKIATKVYGDAGKWEKLYAANRKLIGSNPSDLRAGMVLQLPN